MLFNIMLRHSYVPCQFRRGFMIPLVKDPSGNHSSTGNYRGITISPIISKLLEHVLKIIFMESLSTAEYQFGFKKNSSTIHALHCLKSTVNHYVTSANLEIRETILKIRGLVFRVANLFYRHILPIIGSQTIV